ncbi:hypothetical protein C1645_792515 [Glomus cerebriforme]|uniref:Uncharacterized protein n=1 Tax=Glomus cerebriforme TaxID=658196 RepID=A0A397S832_9GLOM|nr:hypothetical protein C1645_792515 [Glomus cerebriforme]
MKLQDLQDDKDDKRNSNGSLSSNKPSSRTSVRMSTYTINSDMVVPPPIYYTTTIHDPPMPLSRNSSRSISKYLHKNLKNRNSYLETNYEEGNWSLLDNISLYDKIIDDNDNTFNDPNVNKNNQVEGGKEMAAERKEEIEYSNPLLNPYDSSWTPESLTSSPILSKFPFFESNKNNSPSNLDNNKRKVRFVNRESILPQNNESQYASTTNLTISSENNYINTDLNASEKGEESISSNPNTWKKLWMLPLRDEETKKFTKKFWFIISVFICLILLLTTIGICVFVS